MLNENDAAPLRQQVKWFALFVFGLSACFAFPLSALARYSWNNEFFSYIPLIPIISLYLVWIQKSALPRQAGTSRKGAALAALGGLAVLIGWQWAMHSGWRHRPEDYMTAMTSSFLLFLVAGCFLFFGSAVSKTIAFPLVFLVFMVPMPSAMLDRVTLFFQQTSAVTASGMLTLAGMPMYRDGLILNLPGYPICVAPECSGIHSTMVLIITAVLAGHMFLRSGWKRVLLILFVIPLAILRNGFRIFVVSELCVRISHDMINSPIHRKGGPIFFALSLIPFFALLIYLRKSEHHDLKTIDTTAKA
jgi:exosortase C (VPDSG-CTERM-specific)